MPISSIYAWALASLAGIGTTPVNDFASPAGYLVNALNNLIQVTGSTAYVPPPTLPKYLSSSSAGTPWGDNRTVSNTNPLDPTQIPNTGMTRTYTLKVTRGIIATDGFNKSAILVNGQYPGPLIEANWGDWIEVTIQNQITAPEQGTSIHLHGLGLTSTPWYDGTPGISQCPIAPGSTFTMKVRADVYGTSWYHSHYSAQYTSGVYGRKYRPILPKRLIPRNNLLTPFNSHGHSRSK